LEDGDSDLFKYRGWPHLGPNKGQNKENFDKSSKNLLLMTTGQNASIFGMEYPWGKETQVCSNKVSGVAKTFKQFWR